MDNFISIIRKLKYLGLLGLPVFFSDAVIWRYFWLFWIFGLIEMALTFQLTFQALRQLAGIPVIYIKHGFRLPDIHSHKSAVKYSLPFNGQWTVVNGGVNAESSHSWNIPTQRYAYDFIITDKNGASCSGDATDVKSYYCYGKDILAPADGTVVYVNNGQPDAKILGNGATDPNIKDIRGNCIIMKHAGKEYSFIGHLMSGSISVRKGQQVKRGEKIARCGNSGNTSEPHVHFHVQDGKGFFTSAGLPVLFDGIKTGYAENYDKLDPRKAYIPSDDEAAYLHRGQCVENAAAV